MNSVLKAINSYQPKRLEMKPPQPYIPDIQPMPSRSLNNPQTQSIATIAPPSENGALRASENILKDKAVTEVYRGFDGLNPAVINFYKALNNESLKRGWGKIGVGETLRSPERQRWLYAQGRTRPGAIVTKTLNSRHIKGEAMDIVPPKGYSKQVRALMKSLAPQYGIKLLGEWDPAHFEVKH